MDNTIDSDVVELAGKGTITSRQGSLGAAGDSKSSKRVAFRLGPEEKVGESKDEWDTGDIS